ncbi:MAG: YidC/Oxa1 family membrane protein insertase [Tissierellia bacterium]|nr:YidC/Oxa1 family membrane protein insertase [Tissierellia bacterium]
MMNILGQIMGTLMRVVYDFISNTIPTEPEQFSYYAMAIIVTTFIFKLVMIPLSIKQAKSTAQMQKLQPEIQKLQEKYGKDAQTLARKQQELYAKEKINPMSGCLPLLIQMPILLAFYRIFLEPTTYVFTPAVYEAMNKAFFWIPNLNLPDPTGLVLPLIAGGATYLQQKMMQPPQQQGPGAQQAQQMTNTMSIMMPIMIFMMYRNFSAGIALYWVANVAFSIAQQKIVNKIVARD